MNYATPPAPAPGDSPQPPTPAREASRELTAEQQIRTAAVDASIRTIAAVLAAGNKVSGGYHHAVLLGARVYAGYITDGEMP